MSSEANINDIDILNQLRSGVNQFASSIQTSLLTIRNELTVALEWVEGRERYWQQEIQRRTQALEQARRSYQACMSSGDSRNPPNCSSIAAVLRTAETALAKAQEEHTNVVRWRGIINNTVSAYQVHENRVRQLASEHSPKASSFLSQKLNDITPYVNPSVFLSNDHYVSLDSRTYAHYNSSDNVIEVNDIYQGISEQALITPFLAHEAVHAQYSSEDPIDMATLQHYVEEELKAYKAQLDEWMKIKDDFYARYSTPALRSTLGVGQDLLAELLELEQQITEMGWDGFRQYLVDLYEKRLPL